MKYSITPMKLEDREAVMDIFNFYIKHSFAAYREDQLPNESYDMFLEATQGYPTGVIRGEDSKIFGFGLLSAHKNIKEFSHTADITYFLHPDYRGAGLGKVLLEKLETEAQKIGISILLASISSKNPQSQKFHKRNGFNECGRFVGVGKKNGEKFDVIWMQKLLL